MSRLKLITSASSAVTCEADPDDEWSRDSTSTSWHVKGVQVASKDDYDGVTVGFDATPGEAVFVVYAIYSTGDSFGHDESAQLEFIDAFKSADKAAAAAQGLQGSAKGWTREDGSFAEMNWKPWDGYFESLEEMNVEAFVVQP